MPISMKRTLPSLAHQDNHQGRTLPFWFAMTDYERLPDPKPLIPHLPHNCALIVRDLDTTRQLETVHRISPICKDNSVTLMASLSRPPRQLACDGVHIPEKSLIHWKKTDIFRLQPKIISSSAHSFRSIARATNFGVDACLLSPVFATKSHKNNDFLGMPRFTSLCHSARVPIIGLGGISTARIHRVFGAGAAGIAGIGLFEDLYQSA